MFLHLLKSKLGIGSDLGLRNDFSAKKRAKHRRLKDDANLFLATLKLSEGQFPVVQGRFFSVTTYY